MRFEVKWGQAKQLSNATQLLRNYVECQRLCKLNGTSKCAGCSEVDMGSCDEFYRGWVKMFNSYMTRRMQCTSPDAY